MIRPRPSNERGHADHGWLVSHHTFSFADYRDPAHMGFRSLRVINEDFVAAGTGFGTHPHRDMEILTWVLEGEVTHQDSMGNQTVIRRGEVQVMSAGTGVMHSEHNLGREAAHFLQIWIRPERHGLTPSYSQEPVDLGTARNRLHLVAGRPGSGAAVTIHQDAKLYAADLDKGAEVAHALASGRGAWVQVTRGEVRLGDLVLRAGDGAAIEDETSLALTAAMPSQVLVFDLA